jgi:hypothetical protein
MAARLAGGFRLAASTVAVCTLPDDRRDDGADCLILN